MTPAAKRMDTVNGHLKATMATLSLLSRTNKDAPAGAGAQVGLG
jgi:hypothetical protein